MQALKFYKKYLKKKFPDLLIKTLTFRIIELPTKDLYFIKINLSIVATSRRWINSDNYAVSLESNNEDEVNG